MKTKRTRIWKPAALLFAFLFLSHLLATYLPQFFFRHKIVYKSFVVYSHSPLPENIFKVLDKAELLLKKTNWQKPDPQKVFLCNSFAEFSFFAFQHNKAFAVNQQLTGNILIAKANAQKNRAFRNDKENNSRSLSGVIAHETTHTFINQELGFLRAISLATWKKEGYCDFIARESTLDFKNGIRLLCKTGNKTSHPAFQYFKYRLFVEELMQNRKLTFQELATSDFDLSELNKALQQKYCSE